MIDATAVVRDSRRLVGALVEDLRRESVDKAEVRAKLDGEWESARAARRTGLARLDWENGWFAQVAVGWVLGAVFVRFCEDNGLVGECQLGGVCERLAEAKDRRQTYLVANPNDDDRHWLVGGFEEFAGYRATAALFDVETGHRLLERRWHVVVGNPPYITPKDPALNTLYRERFEACHRQYSLGVPFTEQFFWLAQSESFDARHPDLERAGYVGMITANSFMKREFGDDDDYLVPDQGPQAHSGHSPGHPAGIPQHDRRSPWGQPQHTFG